ncbi:hypothetical protein [Microvirga sp. BSC39]|uniref:hypothetical protein n=1 Tax=Microvirga sp. BSC39 TaxID=1549810 RepID=UPI0004E8B381|nr:hypothetical protein [Microvirga sp. BSC39]KFG68691.1 hypothetical protein JH26_14545 [Microvirga sp. BSC39]
MSLPKILTATFAVGLLSMSAINAQARDYRVESESTKRINLRVCDDRVRLDVTGDRDTDLDFRIISSNGDQIFRDDDLDDRMTTTLDNSDSSDCSLYTLYVVNLGDVFNEFSVDLTPVRASASRSASYE